MENRRITDRRAAVPANTTRLAALLDKLVAVQLGLEPVCKARGEPDEAISAAVEACEILHTAIVDLRDIIGQVDGTNNPPLQPRR